MLHDASAFSSFSVDDIEAARAFYRQTLGLTVRNAEEMPSHLELHTNGAGRILIYPKPDHAAATFTVLNFIVKDVEAAVDGLTRRGVRFEIYREEGLRTDDRGISNEAGGPKIAWFRDPAGNILSVLEQ